MSAEWTCHRARCRGAAAVEMALVLPLLMLLVLGTIDWGYYFFVSQVVTNASREGARAGTLHDTADEGIADATATVTSYLAGAGLDPSRALLTVDATGDSIAVDLRYPVGSITGFAEIVVPATMHAYTEMRRP